MSTELDTTTKTRPALVDLRGPNPAARKAPRQVLRDAQGFPLNPATGKRPSEALMNMARVLLALQASEEADGS